MHQSASRFNSHRFNTFYTILLVVFAIFIIRLFYIQVIQHNHYRAAALSGQLKEYEIPASRGVIEAHDGNKIVPIVLNIDTYTLFADPKFITDPAQTAARIANAIGGNAKDYEQKMRADSRYSVLTKKLTKAQKQKIEQLNEKGIGLRAESIRAYPQGNLAAQVLGFVNDENKGTYGIEQFLDASLRGKPGELKAITDINGIPLVASSDNVRREPVPGKRTILTLDITVQRRAEELLKNQVINTRAKSGSVIVLDPSSGAVKAMANYPTYNPAEFYKVKDPAVFTNNSVGSPLEVGSTMKTLTVAAGLDTGAIKANGGFFDPAVLTIDDHKIKNVEEDGGAANRSIADILHFSLNTGAVYVLKQLGGGTINQQARSVWHDYLTKHYFFGTKTGIEQGYEAEGNVPDPNEGYGLNLKYANTTFGQGLTITPLQLAAAFAATINGGTYYRPHLVESKAANEAYVIKKNVVSPQVSEDLRNMHQNTITRYLSVGIARSGYNIGGKTGTAEIANPAGGYYTDRTNGTFIGFVGGDKPQYVVMVRIDEPKVSYYAGTAAAAPLFRDVTNMLIDAFSIRPKS